MAIKIYNTLSGKKEPLPRPSKKPLRLFVCGPTVYDLSHIGHARIYIFFDIFVRYLKSLGLKVFYLQNITDVDDKIIARAREKNITPIDLAKKLTKAHLHDMRALNITTVNRYAPATKFIPEIVKQVQTLIKRGYAYEIPNDGHYYDIKRFPDYGKLSRRTAEQADDAISRIDESVKKRNKGDFCLWKFSKPGEPKWKASFGDGRPGWHIEDTAISEHYFGPRYEIHGGGLDLKFPHHEAEIAQAEAVSGKKPLAKIWMHVGLLNRAGEKMSKSLDNFITIQDFLKKYSPNALRLVIARSHYRSPLNYEDADAISAEQTLNSLAEFLAKLELIKSTKISAEGALPAGRQGSASGGQNPKLQIKIRKCEKEFAKAMANDINTPEALAAIFNLISATNKVIWRINKTLAKTISKWLLNKLNLLGIELKIPEIPAKIRALAGRRELLRSNKQFDESDVLRRKIDALGYKVEDTPRGQLVLEKFKM